MTLRLKIMLKAIKIRLERGEKLEDILASYPKLSDIDKDILMDEYRKEFETDKSIEIL